MRNQALEILQAMGITNPNRKGQIYDYDSLSRLLESRMWSIPGKSWNDMRDIFLEPIIENLIRRNTPKTKIDSLLGRGSGYTTRYILRRWNFNSFQEAKVFFASNYLGLHEVNYYLD